MHLRGKKIVVVGAGLGGLTFCLALDKLCKEQGVETPALEVFERDKRGEEKDFQNYSLSIRTDSGGVQALEKVGVLDHALKHTSSSTEGFYLALHSPSGCNIICQSPPMDAKQAGFRPVRYGLWTSLFQRLPSSVTINWGQSAVDVIEGEKNLVKLEDGREIEADIVVVADGTQSQIAQKKLATSPPSFTGLVLLCGSSNKDPPPALCNKHGLVLGDDGVAMFVGHEEPGKTSWAVSFVQKEPHAPHRVRTATKESQQAVFDEAFGRIGAWPDEIKDMMKAIDLTTVRVVNGFDKVPCNSNQNKRIVFIGDASHPVTPFSGNGANMALVDGYNLAEQLVNPKHLTIDDAINAFEAEMIPRVNAVIQQGRSTIEWAHAQGFISTTTRNLGFRAVGVVVAHPTAAKVAAVSVVTGIVVGALWYFKRDFFEDLFSSWTSESQ